MRWIKQPDKFKHGDSRIVLRFLFLPTTLLNDDLSFETRWLEFAHITQRYNTIMYNSWDNTSWK